MNNFTRILFLAISLMTTPSLVYSGRGDERVLEQQYQEIRKSSAYKTLFSQQSSLPEKKKAAKQIEPLAQEFASLLALQTEAARNTTCSRTVRHLTFRSEDLLEKITEVQNKKAVH